MDSKTKNETFIFHFLFFLNQNDKRIDANIHGSPMYVYFKNENINNIGKKLITDKNKNQTMKVSASINPNRESIFAY